LTTYLRTVYLNSIKVSFLVQKSRLAKEHMAPTLTPENVFYPATRRLRKWRCRLAKLGVIRVAAM
jgi:hypothetical protein